MNNTFKKDKLSKLSNREQAREKLPTYYGSRDNYYHGVNELLNNSTDEIINNFDRGIITIELDESCKVITVTDTGRGIPIDDIESVELLFETLFASGKYETSSDNNSGVNGVGTCVLNYTSDIFICNSYMNGKHYRVSYSEGGQNRKYECLGDTSKNGTEITFKLDEGMYTETKFSPIEIETKLRRASLLTDKIVFRYIHLGETKEFNNTISSYFEKYSSNILGQTIECSPKEYNKITTIERKGEIKEVKETANIEVVFGICVGELAFQETMLNGNYLKENGTIFEGIVEGFRDTINKYCKDNKLLKKGEKQNISLQDIESGVSFVARLFSNIVEFEGQTKFSTKKKYYKQVAKEYIIENLEIIEKENKKFFNRLVEQILICKRANENNEKAKQILKKKLTEKVDSINGQIEGFVDCELSQGGELFLTEGKSALGSIVLARDSKFQAGYPLRGKLINALKNSLDKVLKNEEVIDIIRLLGCGVEIKSKYTKDLPTFDLKNLRWEKIILTSDADSDGKQINVLILTNLYKLCPSLITEGYVYIALPPLFEIKVSDTEKYYALTTTERDKIINEKVGNRKYEVHRLKGLGETSKEVMAQTVCNPKTRVLQRVTVEDISKMENSFEVWLDKKVEERKDYIVNNLHRYLIEPPIEDVTDSKDISNIIVDNMMDYSAETIFDRAIASIESGLKPSQQRSLWAMYVNKVFKLTKSLNITGEVTKYHPHGSVYGTIVNMAQEDRHQLPLIIGEGNFGQYTSRNLTEASDRYTNIKLSPLAIDSLKEVENNFVEMINTYDNKNTMPLYIPSKYPIILTQASEGMAVGMASSLPSFNFNEVCEAIIKYIRTKERTILIPDFATYGFIKNNREVIESINYRGKGTLKLRGRCVLDEDSKTIEIKEIPYGAYREDIINKVIDLVKEGKLKEVISIKDSTDLKGLGIKIECRKNTNLKALEQKLYRYTNLESTYSCNMNVLYNGIPNVQGVWSIIPKWIEFRKSCIVRSLTFKKKKIEKELHLLNAFKNIVEHIEKVIEIIRFEDNPILSLQNEFDLDETQAKYIYELQLKYINKIYIQDKINKIKLLSNEIDNLSLIINTDKMLMDMIVQDLEDINKKFKSPRRTVIIEDTPLEKEQQAEEIEDYNVQFVLTKEGYFKKIKLTTIKNNSIHRFKDGDSIISERNSNNRADLLVFTNKQNCYKLKADNIENHKTSSLGVFLPSLINLEENEQIIDVIPTVNYEEEMLVAFNTGRIVRLPLKSYYTKTNRTRLMNAIHSDLVVKMLILKGEENYVLKSSRGKVLIFNSKDIPLKTTKNSQGVIVMKHKDIEVVDFKHISEVKVATIGRYTKGKAGESILLGDII